MIARTEHAPLDERLRGCRCVKPVLPGIILLLSPLRKFLLLTAVVQRIDWAPVAIALVLFTAAALKTQKLWTEPALVSDAFENTPAVQLLTIELELLLGAALLFRIHPRLCKWLAFMMFSLYLVIASLRTVEEAHSCACFGNIELAPWIAIGIDCIAILLLASWPAADMARSGGACLHACFATIVVSMLVFVPAGWHLSMTRLSSQPLRVTPRILDAGKIQQGESRTFEIVVDNELDKEVLIDRLESSCPCLSGMSLPWRILPGKRQHIVVSMDLHHQREFVGAVQIEYRGVSAEGVTSFRGHLRATIIPRQ